MIEGRTTEGGLDLGALRFAIESKDPDALLGFYTEDAELRIENAALPDGVAFELKGRPQIKRYLHAVCEQEMDCLVEDEVVFDRRSTTFGQVCEYAEGTRISVRTTLEMTGGVIGRRTGVVERPCCDGTNKGGGRRGLPRARARQRASSKDGERRKRKE